jgi:hypothetical protein
MLFYTFFHEAERKWCCFTANFLQIYTFCQEAERKSCRFKLISYNSTQFAIAYDVFICQLGGPQPSTKNPAWPFGNPALVVTSGLTVSDGIHDVR